MLVSDTFSEFLDNLVIQNAGTISLRYGELTAALNKRFRDTESKTANTLQVGSFGRKTGINGLSDLDMLYIMPQGKWATYEDGGQLRLLQHARDAIKARYPSTTVKVDRLVVTVTYTNFHVEVQPVFEQADGSYKYPDSKDDGSWKITKPREEMEEISAKDTAKNSNLKRLCKMARAWRNKHGLEMGGLLVDTLAYNFLSQTSEYDTKSFMYYDCLSRDFFLYLWKLPEQDRYAAPGSRQWVRVKKKFQRKARKAYALSVEAIEAEKQKNANEKWRKVFGRPFPLPTEAVEEAIPKSASNWRNTEEFIEDKYPVDIRYTLKLDCEVKQSGFRTSLLRNMLADKTPLFANKSLEFWVDRITVPEPYTIKWKVLNRGDVAKRRDCVRGQIWPDGGRMRKTETTNFRGDHIVECFAIKDDVVVAKDRIHVPIETTND
ncbi:nucleotide-binding domain-containing protein [Prosthecobacter dejongeii]|uniref:Adenylyl/Guanylyl and SMODS C-terminal sensor domain-containing protein n=1 Tax=Prosthecobacter dejongeii TaxID=48465 RepID=A0A7W7YIG6_9BACT|nr:nucleotidyltransferase [Prosthecobacter dejongeii]MBB5036778.1 hypothetical protein [Prosthecobacter dejongeii]